MTRHLQLSLRLALMALALSAVSMTICTPAAAVAGRVFMGGDSLVWQTCEGGLQRFPVGSPRILRERDGGCHGWSGATTAEFNYEIQGGRFFSDGPGQPHPRFHDRGQRDPWSVREAMDRASILIIGLGTNETNRERYLGRDSPWPIQLGPGQVPGHVSPAQMAGNIDYIVWLANGRPVYWYDVAVPTTDPDMAARVQAINNEIWHAQVRHRNFRVLPWSTKVREEPDLLRANDVHMTDRGRDVRWALATDVVREATHRR